MNTLAKMNIHDNMSTRADRNTHIDRNTHTDMNTQGDIGTHAGLHTHADAADAAAGDAGAIVQRFWSLMASNDFFSVGDVLADSFVLDWPQSGERLRGRENFARMNAEYPAHGPWTFRINTLVSDANRVVSDVTVSDGVVIARAITFFTVHAGRIQHITEYWPDPYPAPANRAHLVERMPAE